MKRFVILILSAIFTVSCSINSSVDDNDESKMLSLATWNVQTFFDSQVEGTEYSDFQNLAKWSNDKYLKRLERLCEVMTALNADVFVLEEIENAAVVQDISNLLAGKSWERNKSWSYACFAREAESSIGCAVFSRYELKNLQIHSMCVKSQSAEQPSVRPLMQVTVDVSGKEMIVFVNHWKSKSGGEAASEIWRDWQESVLADVIGRTGFQVDLSVLIGCQLAVFKGIVDAVDHAPGGTAAGTGAPPPSTPPRRNSCGARAFRW